MFVHCVYGFSDYGWVGVCLWILVSIGVCNLGCRRVALGFAVYTLMYRFVMVVDFHGLGC